MYLRYALIAALGLVCAICLLYACGSPREPAKDTAKQAVERGKPIVSAIDKYRTENGLWPSSLADLSPEYLPAEAAKGWVYRWDPEGYWQITAHAGLPDWAVRYAAKGNTPGWAVVVDGVNDAPLDIAQPLSPPSRGLAVTTARRRELERRVKAHPQRVIHYQALFCTLLQDGDYAAARALCEKCLAARPDHWWSHLAFAEIEARRGKLSAGRNRLQKWARAEDDFARGYILTEFLYRNGRLQEAVEELKRAATRPLAHLYPSNDAETLGYGASAFAWRAGIASYRAGHYDIALTVCDRWEEFEEKHRGGDPGYLPLRAASYLALGQYEAAAAQLRLVPERCVGNRGWNNRLEGLAKAVANQDKGFRYEPRVVPAYPSLFTSYE